MYLKITLHSAAAEEIIKNYITFLDPGGINYVIIVGPTVLSFLFFYPPSGLGGPENIHQNHPLGNHPFANPRE